MKTAEELNELESNLLDKRVKEELKKIDEQIRAQIEYNSKINHTPIGYIFLNFIPHQKTIKILEEYGYSYKDSSSQKDGNCVIIKW